MIDNKITDKITKVSSISPKNSLQTVTNGEKNTRLNKEIPKERYISPEKRQKIIDDLRVT